MAHMADPSPFPVREKLIDLTGLPDEAVEAVHTLVGLLWRRQPAPPRESSEDWKKSFDNYVREVASRADAYPPGFAADDSRESIYEGRGE